MMKLKVKNSIELREYLFELMDQYGKDGIRQIMNEYETQSILLEAKMREDFKRQYVETRKIYINSESFCRKCHTLWAHDKYCTNCGEKK